MERQHLRFCKEVVFKFLLNYGSYKIRLQRARPTNHTEAVVINEASFVR